MVFSSITFLYYFFPLFLLLYYLAAKEHKNFVILIGSAFFYAWGAPLFIFVILGTTLLDFHLVKWMNSRTNVTHRRLMLALSVSVNLGLLFYFKYCNFFIENVNAALSVFGGGSIQWTELILPIGISFYTFETITYVVDVYRKVHKPLNNFWDYQTYIILFPKLIAGPIIRYHELADQITDRSANETIDNRLAGFYRFIIGLSKKVLIANTMGAKADEIMSLNPAMIDTTDAWIGILAYTFQIYFDFSGYSDMAIGMGKMMGFKFPENFDNPYISQSISEFWRRWHITLGRWMKNYLYIPLGGNKVSNIRRLYFNLGFVFLVSGLWHGASWNFVIWGAFHGTFLILDRIFLLKFLNFIGKWPSILLTFFFSILGWVIFRIENLDYVWQYYGKMFEFKFDYFEISTNLDFITILFVAIFFSFFAALKPGLNFQNKIFFGEYKIGQHVAATLTSLLLLIICTASITASGFNPFIYFRF